VYQQVSDLPGLFKLMETYLEDFNSTTTSPMKLVLFTDAMEHVSRISRIISQPLGNALLLGVGCSGRRSLARLAAYMCDYEVFQIEIRKGYGNNEWKEVSMYAHLAVEHSPITRHAAPRRRKAVADKCAAMLFVIPGSEVCAQEGWAGRTGHRVPIQ
jgi:hypothetical protein